MEKVGKGVRLRALLLIEVRGKRAYRIEDRIQMTSQLKDVMLDFSIVNGHAD